jgi:hypothetical protein
MARSLRDAETSAGADRQGTAGPVVVVGSAPVVVGPVVGSVLVVVVGAAVVVGTVVVGATVVGATVVGAVAGGWVVVAPKVENASVVVVVAAVAGAWAVAGPAALVALLEADGTASGVGVDRVGAVVGARGPVGGAGAGLGVGSAGTVGSARAGARRGGDGWGSRVAEATSAARTAVVSPKATSPSLQGHRDLGRCLGRDGRCRGRGVGMGMVSVRVPFEADAAHWYDRCLVISCYAVGRLRLGQRVRQVGRDHRAQPWLACPAMPTHAGVICFKPAG